MEDMMNKKKIPLSASLICSFGEWPVFANLKELELILIAEDDSSLLGVISLKELSPYLQKFSLKLDYLDLFEEREVREVRNFPHEHIKVVEFARVVGVSN